MRKIALVIIVVVGVLGIAVLFGRAKLWNHELELRTYFQDAQGLRPGAQVRMAGVDVGTVREVRVRPDLKQSPAEVVMVVSTPYELKIPRDSTVSLAPAGVLGEMFAQIEIEGASGAPANSGTILKSRRTETLGTKELLEDVGRAVKSCEHQSEDVIAANRAAGDAKKTRTETIDPGKKE
jgi:phospholipid/cholesterol/gamma-HCH transport system substrate-binding protein